MRNRTKEEKIDIYLPIICALVYFSSYLGRHSYNANIAQIIEAFGITKTETGLVTTFFFFSYGIGQFVHGILCRKYSEKYTILLALFVCAVTNLFVFLGIDFNVYKYLWLINGICLSTVWPLLTRILSKYLSPKALDKAVILMGGSVTVGYLAAYGFAALVAALGNYKLSFLLGAVASVSIAIVWYIFYTKLGLNKMTVKIETEKASDDRAEQGKKGNALRFSLLLTVITMGVYAVFSNLLKDGLHTWLPQILVETFNLSGSLSTLLSLVLSIFGLFASILVVQLNKRIKNFLTCTELLFLVSSMLVFFIIKILGGNMLVLCLIAFGCIALCMHMVGTLITSVAPLMLREQMDAGMLSGVLNGACYVGSILSSYGLARVADSFGWMAVFYVLLLVALVPGAVLLVKGIISVVYNKVKLKCN